MENTIPCPQCNTPNPNEAVFCMNCGKALRDMPQVSTTVGKQAFMYIISAIFTPLGLGWGIKYVKQKDLKAKRIGIAIIVITVVSLVVNLWIVFLFYQQYYAMLNEITASGV